MRTSVAPQRVRRSDGSWTPILTRLTPRADGLYHPEATLADVAFSSGGTGPLVTWREDGSTFTLSWPTPLPPPTIDGATATYESVLPDVDLHVIATADGYQHAVEVKSAAAAATAEVQMLRYKSGGDMRVVTADDGSVRMLTRTGRMVALSRSASMWDSSVLPTAGQAHAMPNGERGAAEPVGEPATAAEPAVTSRVGQAAVTLVDGEMRVSANQAMLADPGLTYPLFIDPPFEKLRNKWSYSTSNGENNDATAARVGKQPPDQYSSNGQLYRSYYGFDVNGLNGKHILTSNIRITLDHSESCTPTWVHLFRTSAITVASGSRMAWTTRPLPSSVWLDSWEGNANESGGCGSVQPDKDAEFTSSQLTSDLQLYANSNWDVYTVGLCACNESGGYETASDRWKKFYTNKAWLEVTYNTVPGKPANLTAAGKPCGSTIGTTVVKLKAQYIDADGAANTIRGWFAYKEASAATHVSVADPVARPANNYGEVTIDLGAAANGKTYTFHVQTKDSYNDSSPLSGWCNFTINTTAGAVKVTSTTYPSDDAAHGGPGVPGTFTFQPEPGDAGAANIVSYTFGWVGSTQKTVYVTAGGSHSVQLTPPRHGLNALTVVGRNAAGVPGALETYQFLVGSPSAPIAHWPLTSVGGSGLTDQIGDADLTIDAAATDVAWTPDTWLLGESTLRLDATAGGTKGSVSAAGTGLDTSGSFSVAAWVKRPAVTCSGNETAVSVDGANTSGFRLNYDCATGKWRMRVPQLDTGSPVFADAWASAVLPADRWVHLAGVWNETEQRVRLFVNGQQAADSTPDASWLSSRGGGWKATGKVVLGRDRTSTTDTDPFTGEVRDVRLWNRAIAADDILGTDKDTGNGTEDYPGLLSAQQVARWTLNDGLGMCPDPMSDGTYWSPMPELRLQGCTDPYTSGQTVGYTEEAHDGDGALWFNYPQTEGYGSSGNGTGHAVTDGPVVPTEQSLTVSAWVLPNTVSTQEQVIVRQADGAVKLSIGPSGRWQFAVKSPTGTWYTAVSDGFATAGGWAHLTGVFDGATGTVRIYVNGCKQASEGSGAIGSASSTVMYVGAGSATTAHFKGALDDINVYAGAMTEREASRTCQNF
ncbi:LamG domain-containing protein [Micromonospora sp. WMMD734]|uniref:LamG domain-containing protein n=1 Tax=Micromonospora sp. WMMD734 TaxID=3404129 RepID=UPI003B96567E